jgi:hypothetical protein
MEFFHYLLIMKKYILALGVIATVALTSCGNGSTSKETNDSTASNLDSTAVSATDSTTAEITSDTTSVK